MSNVVYTSRSRIETPAGTSSHRTFAGRVPAGDLQCPGSHRRALQSLPGKVEGVALLNH